VESVCKITKHSLTARAVIFETSGSTNTSNNLAKEALKLDVAMRNDNKFEILENPQGYFPLVCICSWTLNKPDKVDHASHCKGSDATIRSLIKS
jgi:hypothetical protein